MPTPQIKNKSSYREPTYTEQVFTQFQESRTELRETRKELNQRMDRIEDRMDRIENRMDKLEDKIDRLADKIDVSRDRASNRVFIPNISTVDLSYIGIALGVLYSILSK